MVKKNNKCVSETDNTNAEYETGSVSQSTCVYLEVDNTADFIDATQPFLGPEVVK